jgi:hypothetical protein
VAPQTCLRCGGPLAPGAVVCPWCRTPVPPEPRAPSEPDYTFEEDQDEAAGEDEVTPAYLIGGLVTLAVGVLLLIGALYSASCSAGELCSDGASGAFTGIGISVLLVGIILVVAWYRARPDYKGL